MSTPSPVWSIGIFTARESIETLIACINAAILACQGKCFTIDVLVNGNRALAESAAQAAANIRLMRPPDAVRVWYLALADKAHTWNEYVHQICPHSDTTFFIDGYAEVNPNALALLAEALDNSPDALAATGVPTDGRSAQVIRSSMIQNGGIHGNLFALSTYAMTQFQARKFRLPLGLYRTDPLIGAVMMYRFSPSKFCWNRCRIVVHPHASWVVKQDPVWSRTKLLGHMRRLLRQAQGELENRAAREHLSIRQLEPETMARTINGFVNEWTAAHPAQARHVFLTRPLTYFAARILKQEKNWFAATIPAQLLAVSNTASANFTAMSTQPDKQALLAP